MKLSDDDVALRGGDSRQTDEQTLNGLLMRALDRLSTFGVTRITADFDGGGDSGQVNGITLERKGEAFESEALERERLIVSEQEVIVLGRGSAQSSPDLSVGVLLGDILEMVVEDQIMREGTNWWDGEGGQGNFAIDVQGGLYSLDVSVYVNELENVTALSDEPLPGIA